MQKKKWAKIALKDTIHGLWRHVKQELSVKNHLEGIADFLFEERPWQHCIKEIQNYWPFFTVIEHLFKSSFLIWNRVENASFWAGWIYLLAFRISEGLIFLLATPTRKRGEPGAYLEAKCLDVCGRVQSHNLAEDIGNGQLAADTGSMPSASLRSVLTGFPNMLRLDGRFHDNCGMGCATHTFSVHSVYKCSCRSGSVQPNIRE